MKIAELWTRYRDQTERVSTVCRQLALGGAAICWFFKSSDVRFPSPIIFSLLIFVGFFMSDISQYFFTAVKYRKWIHTKEDELKKLGKDIEIEEILPPRGLNTISFRLLTTKVIFLLAGFFCIGIELVIRALNQSKVLIMKIFV